MKTVFGWIDSLVNRMVKNYTLMIVLGIVVVALIAIKAQSMTFPPLPGPPVYSSYVLAQTDWTNERRERYQRDVQRRSHLHGKREIVTEQRYGDGEHEASQPRIRRRARIRDHEEGEDQQRPALELMQRDRERVAEPNGPHQQEGCMRDQKEDGDVGAVRRAQHEDGEKAQERGEPYGRSPLSRRNPHAVCT